LSLSEDGGLDGTEEVGGRMRLYCRRSDCAHATSAHDFTAERNLLRIARKNKPKQAPKVDPAAVGVHPENQRFDDPSLYNEENESGQAADQMKED